MERKIPRIEDLNKFVQFHFKKNPPTIQYRKMKEYHYGQVSLKKRHIYINSRGKPDSDNGCIDVGGMGEKYKSDIVIEDLTEQERYFLTLFHELGHLKIKLRPPRKYQLVKKELRKKYPKDLDKQLYFAEDYFFPEIRGCSYSDLEEKKREKLANRCAQDWYDFKSWFLGDYRKEHIMVEDWARKEFLKHRAVINKVIENKSYVNRSMGIGGFFNWKVVDGKWEPY
jgi:hypothetical protein